MNEAEHVADANADADALPAPQMPASVGAQLRLAREAAGISVEIAAQSLKYSPRQIETLEADNYAALPGAAIVRGFVRGYARFLKLDAAVLLGQLDEVLPRQAADVRPPAMVCEAAQPGGGRTVSLLATVAVVLLLAAGMLTAWHLYAPKDVDEAASTVVVKPLEAPPVVAAPVDPAAAGGVAAGTGTVVAPPPADGATAAPAFPPSDAHAGSLHFAFADRSWVEVTDASRRLLHSSENPGGSRLTLVGKPPFEIVVGNAARVTLYHGDQRIDMTPHTRAEVARFRLP